MPARLVFSPPPRQGHGKYSLQPRHTLNQAWIPNTSFPQLVTTTEDPVNLAGPPQRTAAKSTDSSKPLGIPPPGVPPSCCREVPGNHKERLPTVATVAPSPLAANKLEKKILPAGFQSRGTKPSHSVAQSADYSESSPIKIIFFLQSLRRVSGGWLVAVILGEQPLSLFHEQGMNFQLSSDEAFEHQASVKKWLRSRDKAALFGGNPVSSPSQEHGEFGHQ